MPTGGHDSRDDQAVTSDVPNVKTNGDGSETSEDTDADVQAVRQQMAIQNITRTLGIVAFILGLTWVAYKS